MIVPVSIQLSTYIMLGVVSTCNKFNFYASNCTIWVSFKQHINRTENTIRLIFVSVT